MCGGVRDQFWMLVLSSKMPLLEKLPSHSFVYLFFTGSFILSFIQISFFHSLVHLLVHLFMP